ncbi:MAG: aminotransferase class I/II-fold pyridoxal phosphate-dependent enzyme, partial [bacterium]
LKKRVTEFSQWLRNRHLEVADPPSQIFPLITGERGKVSEASQVLKRHGIFGVPIRYPTVPRNRERVRVSLSALHRDEDIEQLKQGIRALLDRDLLKIEQESTSSD